MLRGRKACQIADELVEGDDETFMARVCNENVSVFPMNVLRAQQRTCFQSWLLQLPPIRSPGPLAANGTAKPRRVSCILFCLKEGQFVPQFFFPASCAIHKVETGLWLECVSDSRYRFEVCAAQ